ncbi:MAG: hypothetical protein ACK47M_21150, partial [Caldilinea sp.]
MRLYSALRGKIAVLNNDALTVIAEETMSPVPERMRIAIFTETFLPKIDGIVSILCLLLQRLQEQGHRVILFGPPGGPSEYAGAEIVGVGGP